MCTDPCADSSLPCAASALCQVKDHALQCDCPAGHLGDPYDLLLGCFKVECTTNDDCPSDKSCDLNSHKCLGK